MINIKENEKLAIKNHSCAHLLAQAVKHLYPEAMFWVGPVIEEGFYYDVDFGEEKLTDLFLKAIDPLSLNKQGEDEGTRYRTGVYFVSEEQVPPIRAALDRCAAALGQPLAVELLPLRNFYKAEEYHQEYLEKNPTGYCHLSPAIFKIAQDS